MEKGSAEEQSIDLRVVDDCGEDCEPAHVFKIVTDSLGDFCKAMYYFVKLRFIDCQVRNARTVFVTHFVTHAPS